MTITEHIAAVRREMAEAARESGRSERDIFLVGASKMNDAAACQEAIAAGVDALGAEPGAGDDRQAGSERL